jgi:hypothetical protein
MNETNFEERMLFHALIFVRVSVRFAKMYNIPRKSRRQICTVARASF